MRLILRCSSLLALLVWVAAAGSSAKPQDKVFDVRQFSARADGKSLDSLPIQAALDACGRAGGGIVRLPRGTYLSKPLFLRDRTTLQMDEGATLQASDKFEDFLNPDHPERPSALVNANGLTNVTIRGRGVIDGAGARWWPEAKAAKRAGLPEPRRRPHLVMLSGCRDVRIEGVTLRNSPGFHLVPMDSEDVKIEGVTIQAPADSPNTDAIDPTCRHLLISKCVLDVGDDNIAIKAGRTQCEDILVTECTFLRGHGMSIGSETRAGVRKLLVKNCTFNGTTSGIRIKSARDRGGIVEDVVYRDITMTNVALPINISCFYPKTPAADTAQPLTATTPSFRNIQIINLTASGPKSAGVILGLPEMCISNVVFENVKVSTLTGLTIRNAKGVRCKNSAVRVAQGLPFRTENADVEGLVGQQ